MNIFEILNNLLFRRKNTACEDLDHDSLQNFQPFLINRWISFYDKQQAVFVNETLNRFSGIFQDKGDSYKFYYNLIPTQQYKKINYIKKKKIEKKEEDNIALLARNTNISQREINLYIDFQKEQSII